MPLHHRRPVLPCCALMLLAGCAVTPVHPERTTRFEHPLGPDEGDWPLCNTSADPGAGEALPDWIVPCGNYGQGFLYQMRLVPDAPPSDHHFLTFLGCLSGEHPSTRWSLTTDAGKWHVPAASSTMSISVAAPAGGAIVGTCVYLPSIMGVTTHEQPLVNTLALQGWRVITIWPSVETYEPRMYALSTQLDDDANAAILARQADAYLAGPAYAAESTLRWLAKQDPDLQHHPVAVVGSSLGALSLPAVVTRLRATGASRVDAAVLIAGGVNLLAITARSSVMRDRFRLIGFTPDPDDHNHFSIITYQGERLDTLLSRAAELSRLDPLHTAPALRDIPVLQLHARDDKIVPSTYGEQLYERLGRPERWTYPFGHTGVFLALPFEADDIARWLAANTFRAPRPYPSLP